MATSACIFCFLKNILPEREIFRRKADEGYCILALLQTRPAIHYGCATYIRSVCILQSDCLRHSSTARFVVTRYYLASCISAFSVEDITMSTETQYDVFPFVGLDESKGHKFSPVFAFAVRLPVLAFSICPSFFVSFTSQSRSFCLRFRRLDRRGRRGTPTAYRTKLISTASVCNILLAKQFNV